LAALPVEVELVAVALIEIPLLLLFGRRRQKARICRHGHGKIPRLTQAVSPAQLSPSFHWIARTRKLLAQMAARALPALLAIAPDATATSPSCARNA
jgi:hypothetical protein